MFESSILGIVQGITEWLPLSSEGVIILIKTNLFRSSFSLSDLIRYALFLHLGTFLAALIYFRKDVLFLIKSFFNYKKASFKTKKIINFYILATLLSGLLGFFLLSILRKIDDRFILSGRTITFTIGVLLLFTAFLQIKKKKEKTRDAADLKILDGILLGVAQGFSILPGISRSGITISALLLRKVDEIDALKLSFLMSLPVVFGANIVLNLDKFFFSLNSFLGLFFSFLFGILTIHILLGISKKTNFGWFVLFFGFLMIFSVLL